MIVAVPRHFMGELARTEAGCQILKTKEVVKELVATVFDEVRNTLDRRASLWALVSGSAEE
jgi:hypothetical protein